MYAVFFLIAACRLANIFICLAGSLVCYFVLAQYHNFISEGLSAFLLGGFLYFFTDKLSISQSFFRYALCTASVLIWGLVIIDCYFIELSFGFKEDSINYVPELLFALTICSLTLIEIHRGMMIKPFLVATSWIGDISYSSYLLHFPLQLLFGLAASYSWIAPGFYLSMTSLVGYFIILIALSYTCFVKFEKPAQTALPSYFLR